jgi:dCMP deaminase
MFKSDTLDSETIRYYMRLAYNIAQEQSPDPSTKVGALLVNKYRQDVLFGVNHFLPNYPIVKDDLDNRARKYKLIEHAERDVIYKAAKDRFPTKGSTLICPWAACTDCARAICLSGIKKVISHEDALTQTPDRWQEDLHIAKEMFKCSGVEYIFFKEKIGDCLNLFNGKLWEP